MKMRIWSLGLFSREIDRESCLCLLLNSNTYTNKWLYQIDGENGQTIAHADGIVIPNYCQLPTKGFSVIYLAVASSFAYLFDLFLLMNSLILLPWMLWLVQ